MASLPERSHRAENTPPSAWIVRFGESLAPGSRVLDVASGGGRHANWFARRGCQVDAVDRETPVQLPDGVTFQLADIESAPWPYGEMRWDGVIVANYLYRPLLPKLVAAVSPGGMFIYETFAAGNERYGRPSRADFLLAPGELLDAVRGRLEVIAYEHGFVELPRPAVVQRIAARCPAG